MRITFLIGSLTGGGAEHVICELATYMSEHGHRTKILTVTETGRHYPLGSKVELATLDMGQRKIPSKIKVVLKMLKLFFYILKEKTDAYVVFLPETIRAIMLFKPFIKAPIIVSERSNPASYSKKKQKQMLKAFAKADGTVFQTENAKMYYADNGADVKNGGVIPNAINPSFVRLPYKGERLKRIVGAGRIIESKNFKLLIEAFAKIHNRYPEYNLVIFGEGPLKSELIQYAQTLQINDKVMFPGYVDNLGDELEKSAMFVMSSNFEGMPNALMEAMALGLPCISTDCPSGGAKLLIENGKNGYLVPVEDVDSLAEAMEKLLSSDSLRNDMGQEAQKICNTYSTGIIYSKWESYLNKIIN